ncbi:MAG: serine/threonine protein kinase [Xanthomonadales bacterium]|nr:serine/threonine protein kinase [Xanthomonadales bacterium]
MSGVAPTLSRWPEVERVLATVIDLPAAERESQIAAACGGDAALAADVHRLLGHEHRLPDALPVQWFANVAETGESEDWIGTRIGPYLIEALIGEGGMSRVFRASRAADFRQRVAIKLLRTLPDAHAMRRFRNERDALAALEHPGIARLLDAGVLAEGTPYLVLELVEGRSWAGWLGECPATPAARIEPLLQVCDALQYAHAHSLIHRDLKPGNLLVGNDGRVRLLDFGVARLLEGNSGTLTRDAGIALTPAYAAPEQWRGETATTATDIYALGLLLHETVSATRVFADADWQQAMQRAQAPVPLPSSCRAPHGLPARQLRGDIDNIVRKACDPDPRRRYASVAAVADDLRAVLSGRPVSARAPATLYVARKFIGRHPLGSLLAAAAVCVIGASLALALREGARAEQRFLEARSLANRTLFDYSDALAEVAGTLPMRRRMVDDALRYLDSLRASAGNDATLWSDLARGYLQVGDLQGHPWQPNLGDFAAAAANYDQAAAALARWRSLTPNDGTLAVVDARLTLRRAVLAHQGGRLDDADRDYRAATAAFAATAGLDATSRLEYAEALDDYGDLLGDPSQPSLLDQAGAAARHAEARRVREALLAADPDDDRAHFALAGSLLRAGDAALGERDLATAEAHYATARAEVERALAAAPANAVRRRELASIDTRRVQVLEQLERRSEAIRVAEQALRSTESLLAVDPDNDQLRQGAGALLGALAKLLLQEGRADAAAPLIERQIAINQLRTATAPEDPDVALALSLSYRRQGELRAARGDPAGAIAAHQQALALQEPIAPQAAWYESNRSISLLHLGRLHAANGETAQARRRLDEATRAIAALHAAHPDTPMFTEDLADVHEALGDLGSTDAAEHYRSALAALSALPAEAHTPAVSERERRLRQKLVHP